MVSNTEARLFRESKITTADRLAVDVQSPGIYFDRARLTQGPLSAGLTIESYYLFTDTADNRRHQYNGVVNFGGQIIGVLVTGPGLDESQFLGAPGTTYATSGRALNLDASEDFFLISPDRSALSFLFSTDGQQDAMRILVSVPEPSSLVLMLTGAVLLLAFARFRARACSPSTSA